MVSNLSKHLTSISFDKGGYVQGGASKFIDTAATKTITMKLRYELADFISCDARPPKVLSLMSDAMY